MMMIMMMMRMMMIGTFYDIVKYIHASMFEFYVIVKTK